VQPPHAPLSLTYNDNRTTLHIEMTGDDFSQHATDGGSTGGAAKSESGPAAAGDGAAADRGGAAATHGGTATTKRTLRERLKRAPWWSRLLGLITVLAVIGATVLAATGDDDDLAVAGFILAAVTGVAGAIPLFRG
jgi:hypothetical protein